MIVGGYMKLCEYVRGYMLLQVIVVHTLVYVGIQEASTYCDVLELFNFKICSTFKLNAPIHGHVPIQHSTEPL